MARLVVVLMFILSFFFSSRRRHTRSTRDWSSDVCSSDLTVFIYDATGQLTAEYANDTTPPIGGGGTSYLTSDHLGSTRAVTKSDGARSEERRVGKECRARRSVSRETKKRSWSGTEERT